MSILRLEWRTFNPQEELQYHLKILERVGPFQEFAKKIVFYILPIFLFSITSYLIVRKKAAEEKSKFQSIFEVATIATLNILFFTTLFFLETNSIILNAQKNISILQAQLST